MHVFAPTYRICAFDTLASRAISVLVVCLIEFFGPVTSRISIRAIRLVDGIREVLLMACSDRTVQFFGTQNLVTNILLQGSWVQVKIQILLPRLGLACVEPQVLIVPKRERHHLVCEQALVDHLVQWLLLGKVLVVKLAGLAWINPYVVVLPAVLNQGIS